MSKKSIYTLSDGSYEWELIHYIDALKRWKNDEEVYILHDDESESLVESEDQINEDAVFVINGRHL